MFKDSIPTPGIYKRAGYDTLFRQYYILYVPHKFQQAMYENVLTHIWKFSDDPGNKHSKF